MPPASELAYKREVEDCSYDEIMKMLEAKVPLQDAIFVMSSIHFPSSGMES